jgi:hypothetical protein
MKNKTFLLILIVIISTSPFDQFSGLKSLVALQLRRVKYKIALGNTARDVICT